MRSRLYVNGFVKYIDTVTHIHTDRCTDTHPQIHTDTHIHTHTHTDTHRHTQTHTDTHIECHGRANTFRVFFLNT